MSGNSQQHSQSNSGESNGGSNNNSNNSNNNNGTANNGNRSASLAASGQHGNSKPITRICRDFVRGNCRRKYCRYPHVMSPDQVVFCHDFQNTSQCPRINCKFLHYSLEEEEHYRQYGEFPTDYKTNLVNHEGFQPHPPHLHHPFNPHVLPPPPPSHVIGCGGHHNRAQQTGCVQNGSCMGVCHGEQMWNDRMGYRHNSGNQNIVNGVGGDNDPDGGQHPFKRFREDQSNGVNCQSSSLAASAVSTSAVSANGTVATSNGPAGTAVGLSGALAVADRIELLTIIRRFEEEQQMLRRRVESNELKIAELRAANEYLMAQNAAQMRLNNVQQCSTVVNPVTVTQTTSQPQNQQVLASGVGTVAVSIAPVQVQAPPIVSIASPQTHIITNSGTPMALTSTSIAPQNITSLPNTSQQLAPQHAHAQQILGTSQITLTPAMPQGKICLRAINGINYKYVTSIGNVQCYTANHLVSSDDPQHSTALNKS